MKLFTKFLGITAVIAVIGFLALPLTGCPEDGGGGGDDGSDKGKIAPTELSGDVTVSVQGGGAAVTGCTLVAAYSGTETVTWQWKVGDTTLAGTSNELVTDTSGKYTATASSGGKTKDGSITVNPSSSELPGTVTITVQGGEAAEEGCTLVAAYSGSETVTWQWKIGDSNLGTASTQVANTAGEYKAIASSGGKTKIGSQDVSVASFSLYTITKDGDDFAAVKGSTPIKTNSSIQTVIDTIKTNANGKNCEIQFGNGTDALDIDTATVEFNNTDGTWGAVKLSGKITGSGTKIISISNNVSITSTGDVTNTSSSYSTYTIYNDSKGTLTISSGTVSAPESYAVYNATTGVVNISGGTVSAKTRNAVFNNTTGTINISGGTVSNTGNAAAVQNMNTGKITVSGTAYITSKSDSSTIYLYNITTSIQDVRLEITGGTIENTSTSSYSSAVYNKCIYAVSISGGTISSKVRAVHNASDGTLNISGGTVSVSDTSSNTSVAVYNENKGTINISGGTVSAITGRAVVNASTGKIIVSGTAQVTSANNTSAQGTITLADSTTATDARLEITGGTVENTASGTAVRNASTGAVTISGGTVSAPSGTAINNTSTGVVTITKPPAVINGTVTGTVVYTP